MATYVSLTQEQKDQLHALLTQARAFAGTLARDMQDAQVLDDSWDATISAIVTTLDPGEIIPNESGLAGASPITKEEFEQMMNTNIPNLLATYNTAGARQLYAKYAGPGNIIGG
jgi:NADP-dependent 3-hydroxy acid dehydrogenase YdfG